MDESTERLCLPRRHHAVVVRTIRAWKERGVVDASQAGKLEANLAILPFDWQRLARYAFVISLCCIVIAIGSVLADRLLIQLLQKIFNAPAIVKSAALLLLATGFFAWGLRLRAARPQQVYRNESVFFLGVAALAGAVAFFGVAMDNGSGHYSILFLLACLIYATLALSFPSSLVWIFALLSLGSWMGTETGYMSGHGAYFLGMNYPARFVLFGAGLLLLGLAGERMARETLHAGPERRVPVALERLYAFSPHTKAIGLLNLFIALWIMSIFGNYGDMAVWHRAKQIELFHWAIIFAATAIWAIWYGLKRDDGMMRGFGITFLGINLYTRYFEYFWDSLHKAFFFAVLAASFWYVGSRAEAIWNFGRKP